MTTQPLSTFYYLDNFNYLLHWITEKYWDLLDEDAIFFAEHFAALEQDSQCLLVRMISRKGPLFRANKLQYPEIVCIEKAVLPLVAMKAVAVNPSLDLAELAGLLTKAELLHIFPQHLQAHKTRRKSLIIEQLYECLTDVAPWHEWTGHQFGDLYHITVQPIITKLLLLFFGNSHQGLTEFVLQDLGVFRYENYVIDTQHRQFNHRDELTQYQQLLTLPEQLALAENTEALLAIQAKLPRIFDNPTLERQRLKLINQLAYAWERHQLPNEALHWYQQSQLPPARERRIRVLEKCGDYEQAWHLLQELTTNPINEHEWQIAKRMAPRLAKKTGNIFVKSSSVSRTERNLQLQPLVSDHGKPLRVEEVVCQHLHSSATPCWYAENQLFNGLFGLWLWPEIFRSVEGAFTNPFQVAPLDLYREDFQQKRPALQNLWQLFDNQQHIAAIKTIFHQKKGISNPFINWDFWQGSCQKSGQKSYLDLALQCIPSQHLKLIFERLLFDLAANRSGFPDLVQFYPEQHQYRLIEVKGPGDRLQDNQQRWLDFFAKQEIPAEVFYVQWQ